MKATIQYTSAIEELKNATVAGKIKWVRNRPESFKYKTMNEDLEDLIVNFTKLETDFILTLEKKDFESTQVLMNLDTINSDSDLREALADLYGSIEFHVDLDNLQNLNKFIDLVKNDQHRNSLID